MFHIGVGEHIASARLVFTASIPEEITEYIRLVEMWPYSKNSMDKIQSNHPFLSDPGSKVLFRPNTVINSSIPTHAWKLDTLESGEWLFQFVAVSQATLETYELFLDWVKPYLSPGSIETPLINFSELKRNFWGSKYKWHELSLSEAGDIIVENKYYPVEDSTWNLYICNY